MEFVHFFLFFVLLFFKGVQIPEGVYLRVGSQKLQWQEGGVLMFMDAFEHEVQHHGQGDRLVVGFQVTHPLLSKSITPKDEL